MAYEPKTDRHRTPKEHKKAETHTYFYLNLSNENKDKLKKLADEDGQTITSEINYIIKDYFKGREK